MNLFLLKVINKLGLLNYFNFKVKRVFNKKLFNIPMQGRIGLSNVFMTEVWMIKLLDMIIPLNNGVFIDVGVNSGQTLIKLKSIDEAFPYIGFEPNPVCVYYVQSLIEHNRLRDVTLIPIGLSDQTSIGEINYFQEGETDSTASIIPEFRPDQKVLRKEYIPIFNFQFLKNILTDKKIGFLKIDVEGAELEVIRCFEELINKDFPFILIEILPVYSIDNSERLNRQNEIQKILKQADYSIHRVIKLGEQLESLEKVEDIGIHSDLNLCDYLCVPKTKENLLKD